MALSPFEVDVSHMSGHIRKLRKVLKLKLGRDVTSEDFLCCIESVDNDHLKCKLYLPHALPVSIIFGTVVPVASHSCRHSAKREAVNLAAAQALKMLRQRDGLVDDE